MLGQIIDLLVKQDDDRRRISFLFLKLLFTTTISAKLFGSIFGTYSVLSITDFKALVDFFINGTAIICFALLYLVWSISYGFTSFVFSFIGMWSSNVLYKILHKIISSPQQLVTEISQNKKLEKFARIYLQLFNTVDIIEIENEKVRPGSNFYKFNDYLLDIKNEKKDVSKKEFSDTIALIIQFIVIYNLLHFSFLSSYWWLCTMTIIIIALLTVFTLVAYVIATMVDIKHTRLLNLMRKLETEYKKTIDDQENIL